MEYKIVIESCDSDTALMTGIDETFGKDIEVAEADNILANLPYIVWSGDELSLAKQYNNSLNKWRVNSILYDTNDNYINTSNNSFRDSNVGKFLKILSIIVLVICVLGSFSIFKRESITGITMFIISVLFSALIYGIGEIINTLQSINNKLN